MDDYTSCELEIWKGDWGLPSVDVDCLKVLAFAKFKGLTLKVNESSNPFRSPIGKLPILRTDKKTICEADNIISFFSNEKDVGSLDSKQISESSAYKCLIEESMFPAIQYMCWVNQQNFNEVIRPWYAKNIPFPFNYYYPGKLEKDAKSLIDSLYPCQDMQTVENEIYSKAQKCMTTLSIRLGDADFFYGSQPNMLDLILYANLAPILKMPLSTSLLQNHLRQCNNLVQLINRISQKYFAINLQEYERTKLNETKRTPKTEDVDFPHKRRDQILAGVFATVAMTTYALSTGIVEVQEDSDSDPEISEFDEND